MKFLKQLIDEMELDFGGGECMASHLRNMNQAEEEEDTPEPSSSGFNINIEEETETNDNFRKVLFTTDKTQLVVMSLKPGEDIGSEVHDGDQFFRFEEGEGKIVIDGNETEVSGGSAAVVNEGSEHNVINTSEHEDLKLYAVYSPPQHKDGTIDESKPEYDEHEDQPEQDPDDEMEINIGA